MSRMINFDEIVRNPEDEALYKKWNAGNKFKFQHPFRLGVCAPGGAGKSNFTLNTLLVEPFKLYYNRIWFLTPDPTEDKNIYLSNYFEQKKAEFNKKTQKLGININAPDILTFYTDSDDLPDLTEELRQEKQCTILIVDDSVLSKKTNQKVCDYIIRCRKYHISIIYLSQSLYAIPSIIRTNFNYFAIFAFKDPRQIANFHGSFISDMNLKAFRKMYHEVQKMPFVPLIIDFSNNAVVNKDLKYRAGTDKLLTNKYVQIDDDYSDDSDDQNDDQNSDDSDVEN